MSQESRTNLRRMPQLFEKLGGRTRARTWDPLIKRHAIRIDISSEFSQLDQNPMITDQWFTAENPTARACHDRRTDASEASGGSSHWSATSRNPLLRKLCFLSEGSL